MFTECFMTASSPEKNIMVYGHETRTRYFQGNSVEKVNAKKIDLTLTTPQIPQLKETEHEEDIP
jgi:hypothetical protein